MRLEPELLRSILLVIENMPAGKHFAGEWTDTDDPDNVEQKAKIAAHAKLLVDEGYLEGIYQRDHQSRPTSFWIRSLTMKGHDFLANARNNTVWKKVLAKAQSEGVSVSISILNGLLEKAAQKYAGLGD